MAMSRIRSSRQWAAASQISSRRDSYNAAVVRRRDIRLVIHLTTLTIDAEECVSLYLLLKTLLSQLRSKY